MAASSKASNQVAVLRLLGLPHDVLRIIWQDVFNFHVTSRGGGWAGTERMRIQNWFWMRFITWNDGDYPYEPDYGDY